MQHLLSKTQYKELRDAYIKFNSSFDGTEQHTLQMRTGDTWQKLCEQFFAFCKQDPQWVKLHDLIQDYERVTNFNMQDHFRSFVVPAIGDNCESIDFQFEYNKNLQQECCNICRNIDTYTQNANAKLTKINSKKYAFRKGARIEKISNDLKDKQMIATKYSELEKQDALKKEYLANHTEAYHQAKIEIKKLYQKHANQVIAQALKTCPGMICIEHNSYIISDDKYNINSSYLNDACNDVKDIIMEMMVLDHEANHAQNYDDKLI